MYKSKVRLYICKSCQLLLMVVDIKYVHYETAWADPYTGEYLIGSFDRDDTVDAYLCNECGSSSEGLSSEDNTLSSILVPIESIPKLHALWGKLKEQEKDINSMVTNGIPVDNQELKNILVEAFL